MENTFQRGDGKENKQKEYGMQDVKWDKECGDTKWGSRWERVVAKGPQY